MKKFQLLFILVLSALFVFSCSSKDDGKEELTDTDSSAVQDDDNSGDTQPDGTATTMTQQTLHRKMTIPTLRILTHRIAV